MTVEIRNAVGLDDIIAVEYECLKCGALNIRKLDEKHRVPYSCGNCGEGWIGHGSREEAELQDLVKLLCALGRSSVNQRLKIKLEIHGAIPSASAPASSERD